MTAARMTPIRVLLVDDHRCILWGLEKLVQSGMPAMEVAGAATSCAEAFGLLDSVRPDIILLDLDLGKESGLETIAQFRARSSARILVLTALADKALHGQAIIAGASGVVETVAPVDTILTAISKVDQGQLWIDRTTVGRIFAELAARGPERPADPEQVRIASLTARERQIVAVLSHQVGVPACTIAGMLHISEHTLRNHLTAIYNKLGVSGRLALFAYAQRHGLDGTVEDAAQGGAQASAGRPRSDTAGRSKR